MMEVDIRSKIYVISALPFIYLELWFLSQTTSAAANAYRILRTFHHFYLSPNQIDYSDRDGHLYVKECDDFICGVMLYTC